MSMVKNMIALSLVVLPMVGLLSSCSETADADPYKTASLRELTRGTVVSKQFKYKLVNPQIEVIHGNLGIVREGNILEFVVARSLEAKLEGMTDGYFELDCMKKFSPFVHFKVEQIATETDTVFPAAGQSVALPRLMTEEDYGVSSFEEQDIDAIPYNNTGRLNSLKGKKLKVSGEVTIETEEGVEYFMLHGDGASFRIAETDDGLELMLKLCAEKGYPFNGGVVFTDVESYSSRIKTKIAGTVDVQYFLYGSRLVTI